MRSKLYLVTERNENNNHEVNFLYTSSDLFGPGNFFPDPSKLEQAGDAGWPYLVHRETEPEPQEWRLHEVDMRINMKKAAHEIAEFLSGAHNSPGSTWENDGMRMSPEARKTLAKLMHPVLTADFGSNKWTYALGAIEWTKKNQSFVDDLDKVFSSLDLIRVNRVRASVTQGEASVVCNGMEVVRYGDEMWLQHKDGSIHNAMSGKTAPGPLYGDIIGGWGSPSPDDQFRKAAITQYDSIVFDYLQREPVREVEVWQLGDSQEAHKARFLSFDENIQLNGSFKPELYNQVWIGELPANNLEDIYYIFNKAHPEGYKSASLSVSDVVKVDGNFYFCDSMGFRKVPFERKVPTLDDRLRDAKDASAKNAKNQQQKDKQKEKDLSGPECGR